MKLVLRDPVTKTLEATEYLTGIIDEYPPEWNLAEPVRGYDWKYEIPAMDCLWSYGMTEREYKNNRLR